MVRAWTTKRKVGGGRTVTGLMALLIDSQVYLVKFALAVVRLQWPDQFALPQG